MLLINMIANINMFDEPDSIATKNMTRTHEHDQLEYGGTSPYGHLTSRFLLQSCQQWIMNPS